MEQKNEVLEGVLAEFAKLAAIPRKSGHEQAVSDFLKDYLQQMGLQVTQDEKNNIIADKAACPGFEQAPLTILQGHMDMVCVAAEGVKFDPLQDAIKLVREEKFLRAEGTSLGADDGIGVAEAIYILKNAKDHGPLRLIVTVDEEQGMTGAIHLDARHLQDAKFLINCDSENYDELTVGSAGSVNLDFSREIKWVKSELSAGWQIEVKGLLGGHSGERIGDGRGNAIRTLAMTLAALANAGEVTLASFSGGKARNAIPDDARMIIATDMDKEILEKVLQEQQERFCKMYGSVDPNVQFVLTSVETPQQVMTAGDMVRLVRLLTILHTGVFAMSTVIPGLVETSANLGVVETTNTEIKIQYFPRSAVDQKLDEFRFMAEEWGMLTGFTAHIGTQSPGWKENKDSKLAKIMAETFKKQNGKAMKVETIHAGLECGWHFRKNPELDMVSIGVTTLDIHSPKERLLLETVKPQVDLIVETLHEIAKA
ncbi:MAG: beta-Ala-His dipeptidase [Selenomonas sp.]|uniref:beta-Ala-His dipeptidase n=1 Tax=Selenomonas sp. TaxID=2053611 RepID=UPI0025D6B345|nr:beta-Ala-His dipeptidase [Selenomonas sp.]MCR5757608.1 beta-Ala-His dipeptidase [Selenomonas sp.]